MNDYVIVTDSTADLTDDLYKKLGIEVVPMEFFIEGESYKHYADAREMGLRTFYQKIKEGKKVTTTQVNSYIYESVFTPILESGKDVLYLCFSSGLSGTYQVSKLVSESMMKKFPGRRVVSIDTLCASVGEGLLVYNAAMLKDKGLKFDELINWIEKNKLNVAHWFVVNDLEHLKQGGRINSIQASIGTVLNLKPLISLDFDGRLVPISKQRGLKKVLEEFIRRLKNEGVNLEDQTIIVGHADNLEFAVSVSDQVKKLNLVNDVIISEIGPVIGAHVGCGMVALTFMGKRNLSK